MKTGIVRATVALVVLALGGFVARPRSAHRMWLPV